MSTTLFDQSIYIAQIAALLGCSFMIWRARKAMNGLGRGMLFLCFLLILRRVDDGFSILDETGSLILSSLVVAVITFDVYQIYKMRGLYAFYLKNRTKRIEDLEEIYLKGH